MTKLRFLGLDVHAETIAVAIAESGRGSSFFRNHSKPPGIDPEDDRQTWASEPVAELL